MFSMFGAGIDKVGFEGGCATGLESKLVGRFGVEINEVEFEDGVLTTQP